MVNTKPLIHDAFISLKLESALKATLLAAAERDGLSLSAWLLRAARREIEWEKER